MVLQRELILLTGLDGRDEVSMALTKSEYLLSRHLPQVRSLNGLQGKKVAFQGKRLLLPVKTLEIQALLDAPSQLFPSQVFLIRALVSADKTCHTCAHSLLPPISSTTSHAFQHSLPCSLTRRDLFKCCCEGPSAFMAHSELTVELSLLFSFLKISLASAAILPITNHAIPFRC